MKNRLLLAWILASAGLPAAWGQLQLYVVTGPSERLAAPVCDYGNVEPGVPASVQFRLRNLGSGTVVVDLLKVDGASFALSAPPQLPQSLASQKTIDFAVQFQSGRSGAYSASLDSVGVSILLTATVPVELTTTVDTGAAARPLGSAPVDFGAVPLGSTVARHITVSNQTGIPLVVPAISLAGGAVFSIGGIAPGGRLLQPSETAGFDVQFSPSQAASASGTLTIGAHIYALLGSGVVLPLPAPLLSVSLPLAVSAGQGAIAVNLDAASRTSGSGTVTLTFQSSSGNYQDPAVAFAAGGQTIAFTVSPGDTQGHFAGGLSAPFQTGTTAGTLTITVELGGVTDRKTFPIAPAVVGLSSVQAQRGTGTVELDITGFDNTRSAGPLAFTFYDASGNAIAPGAIRIDSTAAFASYFQTSAGGTFVLRAVFPVTGDISLIHSFDAAVTNAIGTYTTPRTPF